MCNEVYSFEIAHGRDVTQKVHWYFHCVSVLCAWHSSIFPIACECIELCLFLCLCCVDHHDMTKLKQCHACLLYQPHNSFGVLCNARRRHCIFVLHHGQIKYHLQAKQFPPPTHLFHFESFFFQTLLLLSLLVSSSYCLSTHS